MKVLVTGQSSYAGTQFAKRITELEKGWEIEFISLRNNEWKDKSFSKYDAIYHVAGIVHKKETVENKDLYYRVNRDLTYNLALKAKNEGVRSFVFLSTMAVYGLTGEIGKEIIISKDTIATPNSHYGKSKLEAEQLLNTLQTTDFKISLLRTPMIYGPNCPGNYKSLSKLAKVIAVFPKINNRRSMIYIDLLSDVVAFIIEKELSNIVLIKNPDDVNTLEMVTEIRRTRDKNIYYSNFLALIIKGIGNHFTISKKIFGTIYYRYSDSNIEGFNYSDFDFKESIIASEKSV